MVFILQVYLSAGLPLPWEFPTFLGSESAPDSELVSIVTTDVGVNSSVVNEVGSEVLVHVNKMNINGNGIINCLRA